MAIAGLAALPGTAVAGTAFLGGPLTNAPGGLRYEGNSTANAAQLGWTGPAVQQGSSPAFYVQEHRPGQPGGNPLVAQSPCSFAGPAPAPFGHQDRALCPVTFNGQTVTSYTARLGGGNDTLLIYGPGALGPSGPIQGPLTNGYAEGGPGNDKIESHGPTSADRLFGQGGDDTLRVLGGRPFYPNGVHNVLRGGAGDDTLLAFENGQKDTVICDEGRDRATVDLQDRLPSFAECEIVQQAPLDQHPLVRILGRKVKVSGGQAAFKLKCPKDATSKCRGKLKVKPGKKGGGKVGSSRYSLKKGSKKTVRVRVGGKRGTVRAIASERDDKTTTAQLKLR